MKTLCEKLNFDDYITNTVLNYDKNVDYNQIQDKINMLYDKSTWDTGIKQLESYVSPDKNGLKMLTICLHCLSKTYSMYKQKEIDDKIFFDTMAFLPRFINEHKKIHGLYAFTWAWWFVRQISMFEFRIDDFEFEFMGDNKTISLHIPSDANLKNGKIDVIFDFVNKYYPEYKNANIICESWLLVPELKKLLPEDSNIVKFQNQFIISKVDYDSPAFMDWIYSSRDIEYLNLPENTTLQKNLKKYLLSGKKFGWGYGIYSNFKIK